jgi:hypothetical protein
MTSRKWEKRSSQEKIYKIAEYCGAKWVRLAKQVNEIGEKRSLVMPDDPSFPDDPDFNLPIADGSEQICLIHVLPNYLSDLNAMHEVEMSLPDDKLCKYDTTLWSMCFAASGKTGAIHASAEQRAEAFVLTMEPE